MGKPIICVIFFSYSRLLSGFLNYHRLHHWHHIVLVKEGYESLQLLAS